jgi:hypothetical protein
MKKQLSTYFSHSFSGMLSGTENEGTTGIAAMRVAIFKGICEDSLWKHEEDYFPEGEELEIALKDAMKRRTVFFQRCHTIDSMKLTLSKYDQPPLVIIELFSNIRLAENDGILRPPFVDGNVKDLHASVVVGYNDEPFSYENDTADIGFFKFLNSWGIDWGNKGYGYFSFDYFRKYCYEAAIIISKEQFLQNILREQLYSVHFNNERLSLYIGHSRGYSQENSNVEVYELCNQYFEKIAYMAVSRVGKETVEVIDFFVWPDYQNNGFGNLIFTEFILREYFRGIKIILVG